MSIKKSLQRTALVLGAFVLSLSPALAGGVRIVDPNGLQNFPDIQSAIDAAVDGDVLLVGAGTYPGFTLDGKSVAIFAAPAGASVSISGNVTVRNVSGGSVLIGLHVAPTTFGSALSVTSCSGDVRVESCTFIGLSGTYPGQPAGDIAQSTKVVLVGCTFQAGDSILHSLHGIPGTFGLRLQASAAAVYDSSVVGGRGADSYHDDPGTGGPGTLVLASWLFASKCSSRGGRGGDDLTDIPIVGGACGGAGITIGAGSSAHLLDVTASGGAVGLPAWGCGSGPDISNEGGLLDLIPGTGRVLEMPAISVDRARWIISVAGVPGDQVFLNRSLVPVFQFEPTLSGVCTSLLPPFLQVTPLGVVPASGSLNVTARQRLLPNGVLARVNYLQGYVKDSGATTVLGSPMHVLSLNWNSRPDCNGNGIQDFAEVILGITPDVDHDLIPDGCP